MKLPWSCARYFSFFFNDTATTEIYTTANTLSLHDALPISRDVALAARFLSMLAAPATRAMRERSEEHTSELQSLAVSSYAVFCLKKKKLGAVLESLGKIAVKDPRGVPVLGFFFFNDTATTEIYTTANTLSLHDALPI